jgi:hypothetical protein
VQAEDPDHDRQSRQAPALSLYEDVLVQGSFQALRFTVLALVLAALALDLIALALVLIAPALGLTTPGLVLSLLCNTVLSIVVHDGWEVHVCGAQ